MLNHRSSKQPARDLFPENFAWGAATSSYQIEGAHDVGGRGLSIWDTFCRRPGKIQGADTGDHACEHYHHFRSDVAHMATLGLKAYRFSVSWPRVMPGGTGAVSTAGLGFYDRLVDELLAQGIEPWLTLYHWDLPQELFLRGGWLNPDISQWFADYTAKVVDRLSDRVTHWLTLNEPQCYIDLGYHIGKHAPGLQLGLTDVLLAAHHSLLAHGRAVQVIRARARQTPRVGWAPCGIIKHPATNREEDIDAARRATLCMSDESLWNNAWWYEPVYNGHYPEEGLRMYGRRLPKFASADFDIICQPLDFCGANIYGGKATVAGLDGEPVHPGPATGAPQIFFPADVTPEAMYWGARFLYEKYQLPIAVTENGMAASEWVGLDGRVHDPARIDFLHRYLLALANAIRDGAEVEGYFLWSIFDNFEWIKGYRTRFGLVHVDFETQKRTFKDSARWYREVIRTNGRSLAFPDSEHAGFNELDAVRSALENEALRLA